MSKMTPYELRAQIVFELLRNSQGLSMEKTLEHAEKIKNFVDNGRTNKEAVVTGLNTDIKTSHASGPNAKAYIEYVSKNYLPGDFNFDQWRLSIVRRLLDSPELPTIDRINYKFPRQIGVTLFIASLHNFLHHSGHSCVTFSHSENMRRNIADRSNLFARSYDFDMLSISSYRAVAPDAPKHSVVLLDNVSEFVSAFSYFTGPIISFTTVD